MYVKIIASERWDFFETQCITGPAKVICLMTSRNVSQKRILLKKRTASSTIYIIIIFNGKQQKKKTEETTNVHKI